MNLLSWFIIAVQLALCCFTISFYAFSLSSNTRVPSCVEDGQNNEVVQYITSLFLLLLLHLPDCWAGADCNCCIKLTHPPAGGTSQHMSLALLGCSSPAGSCEKAASDFECHATQKTGRGSTCVISKRRPRLRLRLLCFFLLSGLKLLIQNIRDIMKV